MPCAASQTDECKSGKRCRYDQVKISLAELGALKQRRDAAREGTGKGKSKGHGRGRTGTIDPGHCPRPERGARRLFADHGLVREHALAETLVRTPIRPR